MTEKYLDSASNKTFDRAEAAFKRALELNPDLPLAHKLYAQLEVDLGRAEDAMMRLLERARSADPELFAGLVSACRYCGLLEASAAAETKARRLDPHVRTSVVHTWFLLGDHARAASVRLEEAPYISALSLAALGRGAEAIKQLRELEGKTRTRMRDFMIATRTLLEGNATESVAAIDRIVASGFRDPECLFYLARDLAHIGEVSRAYDLFQRVVLGGFFCFPAMARDPWLDPLRKKPEFTKLLRQAEARHREAGAAFSRAQGEVLLGNVVSTKHGSARVS